MRTPQATSPIHDTMAPTIPPFSRMACRTSPTVTEMAAKPATAGQWAEAPRSEPPTVGSPPSMRRLAPWITAARDSVKTVATAT